MYKSRRKKMVHTSCAGSPGWLNCALRRPTFIGSLSLDITILSRIFVLVSIFLENLCTPAVKAFITWNNEIWAHKFSLRLLADKQPYSILLRIPSFHCRMKTCIFLQKNCHQQERLEFNLFCSSSPLQFASRRLNWYSKEHIKVMHNKTFSYFGAFWIENAWDKCFHRLHKPQNLF